MQTFLPYPNIYKSASCLDSKRLGKQRVEAFQILKALRGETNGWINHPATKMWRGHEGALVLYMNACISEWIQRGFKNTMVCQHALSNDPFPWWFGDERLHASHRSNLLRKDPEFYGKFGWKEDASLSYFWPSMSPFGRNTEVTKITKEDAVILRGERP